MRYRHPLKSRTGQGSPHSGLPSLSDVHSLSQELSASSQSQKMFITGYCRTSVPTRAMFSHVSRPTSYLSPKKVALSQQLRDLSRSPKTCIGFPSIIRESGDYSRSTKPGCIQSQDAFRHPFLDQCIWSDIYDHLSHKWREFPFGLLACIVRL